MSKGGCVARHGGCGLRVHAYSGHAWNHSPFNKGVAMHV